MGESAKSKVKKILPFVGKYLATPVDGLFGFAGAQQLKDPDTKSYASPLRVAAGMQRGYYDTDKGGTPIVKPVPIMHGQVIRAATNKARQITPKPVLATLVNTFDFTKDGKQIDRKSVV